jgi:glycosyltransferase involved in cell wall biosynthesis
LEPLVRSQSPDVLLCYWIYPDAWAGWQVGRALGVPVIAGSRGSDLKVPETVASVRSKIASTVRGVDALLCVSEDLGVAARGLGAPPNRVFAVPNGIDARTFHFQEQAAARRSLDLAAGKRIVVFIGRLVNMKGVLQLSDAVARLNEGGAGTWTAVFIGEGPLRSQLTGPHVLATGPRKPDEIAAWLAAADVFCLPSESEGCPNVVQEALSCGCPVVATSVGGIPDMVGSDCGILVPDHDPERLAKALAQVVALDWDRKKMARTHTRSWEQVAEATFQVCEFAVGSREAYAVGR